MSGDGSWGTVDGSNWGGGDGDGLLLLLGGGGGGGDWVWSSGRRGASGQWTVGGVASDNTLNSGGDSRWAPGLDRLSALVLGTRGDGDGLGLGLVLLLSGQWTVSGVAGDNTLDSGGDSRWAPSLSSQRALVLRTRGDGDQLGGQVGGGGSGGGVVAWGSNGGGGKGSDGNGRVLHC